MYNPTSSRLKPNTGIIHNDTLAKSMVVSCFKTAQIYVSETYSTTL